MVSSRTATALAGLVVSLAASVVLWVQFDTLVAFLFLPFVPFLLRGRDEERERPAVRHCPVCDYRTRDPEFTHCPRDGTPLEREDGAPASAGDGAGGDGSERAGWDR